MVGSLSAVSALEQATASDKSVRVRACRHMAVRIRPRAVQFARNGVVTRSGDDKAVSETPATRLASAATKDSAGLR